MLWDMKSLDAADKNRNTRLDLDRIEVVLFDLDGTLVEVDMQEFIPLYLQGLAVHLDDPVHRRRIAGTMREAVIDMLSRVDGSRTLEQRLIEHLEGRLKIAPERYRTALDAFCRNDLGGLNHFVRGHPLAVPLLEACRANGWRTVLATNPIFPRAVIDARVGWGGLDANLFDYVTSYETSRHCKPHLEYFREVLDVVGVAAESCLMIGNDTQHDMAAGSAGLATCLLTPWRIDRAGPCFPEDWQGTHAELLQQLQRESSIALETGRSDGLPATSAD